MAKKDENQSKGVVVSDDNKQKLGGKKLLKIVLVVLFAVFLMVAAYLGLKKYQQRTVIVCKSGQGGVVQEAVVVFQQKDNDKLKTVVEKIQKTPKYDKDPNCLYPIIHYYTNTFDINKAKENLAKLEKTDTTKIPFAPEYQQLGINSVEAVKQEVVAAEKLNEAARGGALKID